MLEFCRRRPPTTLLLGLAGLCLALAWTGCGRSPTPRLYLLAAEAMAPAEGATGRGPTVLVQPVELPAYLDRPQIVSRPTANEIEVAELHRWAEPLKDNLPAVLRDNLAVLLDSPATRALGTAPAGSFDYKVGVTVLRLEADVDGAAVLTAQWSIRGADGNLLGPPQRTQIRREVEPGTGFPGLVAAESAAVAELSREIAHAILARGER